MTMMTMMMERFILSGSVVFYREAAGCRAPPVADRQCVQTFGHCWNRQLQAKERRNMGHEAQSL